MHYSIAHTFSIGLVGNKAGFVYCTMRNNWRIDWVAVHQRTVSVAYT